MSITKEEVEAMTSPTRKDEVVATLRAQRLT